LSGLAIDPRFQNQGIACQALAFVSNDLKGIKRIDLVVHPRNNAAVRLYLSFGFIIESWKDNHFGDGEPRIVMAKHQ
jgi:ribosomal protein S18 acetylase RimI-like enzyme